MTQFAATKNAAVFFQQQKIGLTPLPLSLEMVELEDEGLKKKTLPQKSNFLFFWYQCSYPHRSRESVSPIYGIFLSASVRFGIGATAVSTRTFGHIWSFNSIVIYMKLFKHFLLSMDLCPKKDLLFQV